MATAGKVGAVLVQTSDTPIAFLDEPMTANADRTRYTITDATKRYWNRYADFVVEVDGTPITSGYSIEYAGGVVVFEEALEVGEVVTVSGEYVQVEQLAGFFNWSLSVNNKTIDVTAYESGEWEEFVLATKNFTVNAEKYWYVDKTFPTLVGQDVVIVCYTNFGTPKTRFEGWATLGQVDINSPVNEIINERLSLTGKDGIYYRAG